MRTISLKVPEDMDARLLAAARRRRRTRSAYMREALNRTLSEEDRQSDTSLFERMRHLVGCAKGRPSDLSTNKKYLEDLGRK